MLSWNGRARGARCLRLAAAALPVLISSPAMAGSAVVRDIFVEEFSPAYPDARRAALQRAMRQAIAKATANAVRAEGVSVQRAESMVSFVEVLEETVRPDYYALRVSIGVHGPNVQEPEGEGPLPAVHPVSSGQADLSAQPRAVVGGPARTLLSLKVPRGNPGALAGYRAMLAGLDVQHVRIHPNPDLLLDVQVSLRRPPARMPEPPPGSGILISEEPPKE